MSVTIQNCECASQDLTILGDTAFSWELTEAPPTGQERQADKEGLIVVGSKVLRCVGPKQVGTTIVFSQHCSNDINHRSVVFLRREKSTVAETILVSRANATQHPQGRRGSVVVCILKLAFK